MFSTESSWPLSDSGSITSSQVLKAKKPDVVRVPKSQYQEKTHMNLTHTRLKCLFLDDSWLVYYTLIKLPG